VFRRSTFTPHLLTHYPYSLAETVVYFFDPDWAIYPK